MPLLRPAALLLLLLFSHPLTLRPQVRVAPDSPDRTGAKPGPVPDPKSDPPFVLVGAGDISSCEEPQGALATAQLIEQLPGTVFAAGDLAYDHGTAREFARCYDPTWGRFRERTRPTPGNHEYLTAGASAYFAYWGAQAGPAGKGYYSYDLGSWHIVVLNTNCEQKSVGGCGRGSDQESWLRGDLAEHPGACLLAYGHHALFSSGLFSKHALHPELKQLWRDLYEARADLVLAGHEHSYERFAPQDPDGNRDPVRGIIEIVAGTGGKDHGPLGFATPNSVVRDWTTFGVLKLTLGAGRYSWEFLPVPGRSFHDSGSGTCHGGPPRPNRSPAPD